jgi:glycosyltransferase involved in cell wall biosynthesis
VTASRAPACAAPVRGRDIIGLVMGGERTGAASRGEDAPAAAEQEFSAARRVTFITPRWDRDGGVGAHVVASAALLARAGVDVLVLAAQIVSDERPPGVKLGHLPRLMQRDVSLQRRLADSLSDRPDIVHLHQIDDDPELVATIQAYAPVIVSAHGYTACTSGVHHFGPGEECQRAHGPGCVLHLARCAHVRNPAALPRRYRIATRGLRALQRADLAVSYSSAVDRHLAANGIRRRTVVPYFPTVFTDASGAPGRGPDPLDPSVHRVLFAGRLVNAKGVGVLLRAAREVDAEFVIAGAGRQLPALRRMTRRFDLQHRVRFSGWLGPEALAAELLGASVVVMPSIWPEPFGIVGIEAHAAARPVIASRTGGIADWLDDGVSGLTVAAGDPHALARALTDLLADPERRRTMGRAGSSSVRARFSPARHLQALEQAYAMAAAARRAQQPLAALRSSTSAPQAAAG